MPGTLTREHDVTFPYAGVQGSPKALEARKPLQVLKGVLREVASRLALLHMSSWVRQQTSNASMRWHRHIAKVDRLSGSDLDYGMR